MKNNIISLIILSIALSSCSDFLELSPAYQLNEKEFYKTEQDFETATLGNYSQLQVIYNASILYLTELTTDNAEITWSSPETAEAECDEMNLTSTNVFVNTVWNSSFKTISRSNSVLEKIEKTNISIASKIRYKGEAHFLRALCYFNMVRLFGNLPLVTESFNSPTDINAFDMSRKPVEEIYKLIISDLQLAITELEGVKVIKSRASIGAANTLLAKVFLTRKEYDKAATILKNVVDSKIYDLQSDYKSLFSTGNESLKESIFEIEYLSGNIGEGNFYSSLFTPPSFNMAIFPGNAAGSGRIVPTKDARNAYEINDIRRPASIMDSLKLQSGSFERTQYGLKFVDFTTGLSGDGGVNFTVLRYADVLLMNAEVLNETGKSFEALNFLNLVRSRAKLRTIANLSQSEMRLALEDERRFEFLSEGHRWFDLVRTGRSIVVMNDYFTKSKLKFTVNQNKLLMPVPQREIDINPHIIQNMGY